MKCLMKFFVFASWTNILILLSTFFVGAFFSYVFLVDDKALHVIKDLAGGNIVAPLAILISATAASIAASAAMHENNMMHRRNMTLDALRYNRFTMPGIRKVIPLLEKITAKITQKKSELDSASFEQFMSYMRNNDKKLKYCVSVLDSYQDIAFGVRNNFYDEFVAKHKILKQIKQLVDHASVYIEWRENANLSGPAESHLYKDLKELSSEWNPQKP